MTFLEQLIYPLIKTWRIIPALFSSSFHYLSQIFMCLKVIFPKFHETKFTFKYNSSLSEKDSPLKG